MNHWITWKVPYIWWKIISVNKFQFFLKICQKGVLHTYIHIHSQIPIQTYTYRCNLEHKQVLVHIKISTQQVSAHTCTHTNTQPYTVCEQTYQITKLKERTVFDMWWGILRSNGCLNWITFIFSNFASYYCYKIFQNSLIAMSFHNILTRPINTH